MPEKRAMIERIAPNAETPTGRLETLTCRSTQAVRALIDAAIRQVLALLHPNDARLQPQRKSGLRISAPGNTTRELYAGRRTNGWRSWSTTPARGSCTAGRSAKPATTDRQAKPKARLARLVLGSTEAA